MRKLICLIGAICCGCILLSQNSTVKIPKTFTHYINEPGQSIKVSVMATKVEMTPKEELTYFWFSSNKVLSTKGGFDGYLLHGVFSSFYTNKNLKEKGCYKNGLKEGKWMSWFENGQVREILVYHNGKKSGRYELYNELGLPMVKAKFSDDKLHGTMRTFANNKLQSKQKYKNGNEVRRKKKVHRRKVMADEKTRKEIEEKKETEKIEIPKEKKKKKEPKAEKIPKQKKTLKERWNNLFTKKKENK